MYMCAAELSWIHQGIDGIFGPVYSSSYCQLWPEVREVLPLCLHAYEGSPFATLPARYSFIDMKLECSSCCMQVLPEADPAGIHDAVDQAPAQAVLLQQELLCCLCPWRCAP